MIVFVIFIDFCPILSNFDTILEFCTLLEAIPTDSLGHQIKLFVCYEPYTVQKKFR